jgi:hypothetical protein
MFLFFPKDFSISLDETIHPLKEIEQKLKNASIKLFNGISLSTINSHCKSKQNVAIIIPYRDRLDNLLIFLNNMHEFLTKQKITYGIFLVEPKEQLTFNRGILMNIGFIEAIKVEKTNKMGIKWDCFIFHGRLIIIINVSYFLNSNLFSISKQTLT